MKIGDANPTTNQIGAGISEEEIRVAVDESGYPLQIFVADILRQSFGVSEEWAFIDRDTGELRSMDLRADKLLFDFNLINQRRVRPILTILAECKQSDLPYVFFESEAPPLLIDHPVVIGLRNSTITIATDDSRASWALSVILALGLSDHKFQHAPKTSKMFSKCVRRGRKIELSGIDAYSHLIRPLVKAINHLATTERPSEQAVYFDAHLSVAVGVLDAPMLAAQSGPEGTVLELVPWVRVLRHEYDKSDPVEKDRQWVLDVVHRDYFKAYIEQNLQPFAEEFASRVLRHGEEIATGKAFAAGMEKNSWTDLESRLRARK
jgi:hypothetical protein